MKTVPLLSLVLLLPAASLLAKGQSELEILRARVDLQDRRIIQLENALNRLTGSSVQTVAKSTPSKAAPSKASASGKREYVVAKGDILTRIAYRHQTTVAAIKKENNLKSDDLLVGQKLLISSASTATASLGAAPKKDRAKTSQSQVVSMFSKPSSDKALTGKYKVKSGDTFYGIARSYQMSEAALQSANPKAKPTRLQIGQVLVVKPGSQVAPAPTSKRSAAVTQKSSKPKAKTPSVAKTPAPKASNSTPKPSGFRTITVHQQMTYGAFASRHGASTTQLNSLNGLNLSKSTMLAKGSELYVPQF